VAQDKPAVLGGTRIVSENIRCCYPLVPNDIFSSGLQSALNDVLKSGMLSNFSKYSRNLENQLRDLLGVKHVLTVANGTTGLEILLSTLPRDSEVLVPSYTFSSTVHAIIIGRLKPKFVDIDKETCNISLQEVKSKITKSTSAILAVNVFGNPCQIHELEEIAQKHQLKLFFDSAAAIGSKYKGRLLGSFGHAEVFSLSSTKVVNAGEGGFIATNDDQLAKELDCRRNYGYSKVDKDCLHVGFNGKLSELNAIFAIWSLRNMERSISWRKKVAAIYHEQLRNIAGIHFQKTLEECDPNFCNFPLAIDSKEFGLNASVVHECLKQEGVETLRYFCPPMHLTKAYKEYNHHNLEQSEILSRQNLCLPIHSHLSIEQAQQICFVIARIHRHTEEVLHHYRALGDKRLMHKHESEAKNSLLLSSFRCGA